MDIHGILRIDNINPIFMKKKLLWLCGVLLLLCSGCEPSYEKYEALIRSWAETEKKFLTDNYAVGDSLFFTREAGNIDTFIVRETYIDIPHDGGKATLSNPIGEIPATCAYVGLSFANKNREINLVAVASCREERNEKGEIAYRHGHVVYANELDIRLSISITTRGELSNSTPIILTPPPTVEQNEQLFTREDIEQPQEWALVRKGYGIVKMADEYGHTWSILK